MIESFPIPRVLPGPRMPRSRSRVRPKAPLRRSPKTKPHCADAQVDSDAARLCAMMETAVAAAFAVPLDDLRAPTRSTSAAAFARQSAMYLTHVVLGQSLSATGALFQRDRTTAAYACRMVEERRDDPAIDRLMFSLEEICSELARGFFGASVRAEVGL